MKKEAQERGNGCPETGMPIAMSVSENCLK